MLSLALSHFMHVRKFYLRKKAHYVRFVATNEKGFAVFEFQAFLSKQYENDVMNNGYSSNYYHTFHTLLFAIENQIQNK